MRQTLKSYGGLASLPQRLKASGWTSPYIVTEFGPPGPWEVAKTDWKAPKEPTGSEKARLYTDNYRKSVSAQNGLRLWQLRFSVGQRSGRNTDMVRYVSTLYGRKNRGSRCISEAWTGKLPKNRAPHLVNFVWDVAPRGYLAADSMVKATITAADDNDTPLTIDWEIRTEETPSGKPEPPVLLTGAATSGKSFFLMRRKSRVPIGFMSMCAMAKAEYPFFATISVR